VANRITKIQQQRSLKQYFTVKQYWTHYIQCKKNNAVRFTVLTTAKENSIQQVSCVKMGIYKKCQQLV